MVLTEWLTTTDNQALFLYHYPVEKPKMVLQFAHGMGEHAGRYHAFFTKLQENGISVMANDHRGHGRTGERTGKLGHFADSDGFNRAVSDLKLVHNVIEQTYPETKKIIMGHSMGSFLSRRFIQVYPDAADGLICSGTGFHQGPIGFLGICLAKLEVLIFGPTHPSKLIDKLSFGKYQRHFKKDGSWLSRDDEAVSAYRLDPLSGFIASSQFFYDLLRGIYVLHQQDEIKKGNHAIPILLFSGDDDAVGDFGKGVRSVEKAYRKAGIKNIELKLYQKGRHEMLFDINRDEVTVDLLNWLKRTSF